MRATQTEIPGVIHVLLVDANQMHCQLLLRALRRRAEFSVSWCALDVDAIVYTLESSQIDVIVIDAEKDGSLDMAVVRHLHLSEPEIDIILLLDGYNRDLVVNAFRSGARGLFCFSESPFRMLCKCIQSVYEGQVWANSEQVHYLLDAVTQVPSLRVVNVQGRKLLTPREEQVVALVADGLSNREIARELDLSEHTIKKYLFRIFDKLGISSRVELVLYAINHGDHLQAEWVAG